jgi:hypothetical protein
MSFFFSLWRTQEIMCLFKRLTENSARIEKFLARNYRAFKKHIISRVLCCTQKVQYVSFPGTEFFKRKYA